MGLGAVEGGWEEWGGDIRGGEWRALGWTGLSFASNEAGRNGPASGGTRAATGGEGRPMRRPTYITPSPFT